MKRISKDMSKAVYEVGKDAFNDLYDVETCWGADEVTDWMYKYGYDMDSHFEIHSIGNYVYPSYEDLMERLADDAYDYTEFNLDHKHRCTLAMSYFIVVEAFGWDEGDKFLMDAINDDYTVNIPDYIYDHYFPEAV